MTIGINLVKILYFDSKILKSCAVLFLALGLGFDNTALAAGIPQDGVLTFDIVRNGQAIGTQNYQFHRKGDRTEVHIKTNINYRLLFIPVYRFEHQSKEVWQNGKLASLKSNTNDNGTSIKLHVYQHEGSLIILGKYSNLHIDRELIPSSLWNRSILDRKQTLTTISGNLKNIQANFVGEEELDIRGQKTTTQHFRLTGEFERELWYDKNDVLVSVRLKANDGSTITYVLK